MKLKATKLLIVLEKDIGKIGLISYNIKLWFNISPDHPYISVLSKNVNLIVYTF